MLEFLMLNFRVSVAVQLRTHVLVVYAGILTRLFK